MSFHDRRYLSRLEIRIHARLKVPGRQYQGVIEDISLAGALFKAEGLLENVASTPCCLEIHDGLSAPVIFNGIVMRWNAQAVGIRFKGVGQKQYEALIQMLDGRSGNAELLERELAAVIQSH